jgi:four helix bundle protein
MSFGHERLDVYRAAIEYVGWAYRLCEGLKGHRNAKDQLLRASQAIPLNIAEGNGKATDGDRRRYFEIARGSALECGAIQDVLEVCGALSTEDNASTKAVLDRIVAMLTKLGRRGYSVAEEAAGYAGAGIDSDTDADSDPVGTQRANAPVRTIHRRVNDEPNTSRFGKAEPQARVAMSSMVNGERTRSARGKTTVQSNSNQLAAVPGQRPILSSYVKFAADTGYPVCRAKTAISSGCESHPVTGRSSRKQSGR